MKNYKKLDYADYAVIIGGLFYIAILVLPIAILSS